MNIQKQREFEHGKYKLAYQKPGYHISGPRFDDVKKDLETISVRGGFLDVGCGRGEVLDYAESLGFSPVMGTEVIPELLSEKVIYAEAHNLPFPDNYFEVVTMLDVIEHLIPGDDELACRELERVAKSHILITANNNTSQKAIGQELHINKRLYEEWDQLFRKWFSGEVNWLKGKRNHVSEAWRIDL